MNAKGLEIYTEMETSYMASLLKKKTTVSKQNEVLNEVFTKAKNTLSVLSANLIAQDVKNDRVFEYYEEDQQFAAAKRENAYKLLLRCKKMYEARS